MTRNGPVGHLGGPFGDHDLGGDEGFASPAAAGLGNAQRPARAQAGAQLPAEPAPALDVERLIDGLVADPHRGVLREVGLEPCRDLLGAPSPPPPPVLAPDQPAVRPGNLWAGHLGAVCLRDPARQAVLHVAAQRLVPRKLRRPGPARGPIGVPLRGRGAVLEAAVAGRRVAPQLARDRRGRTAEVPGDVAHAATLGPKQRDLLALREGETTSRRQRRQQRQVRGWHAAGLPEPPRSHHRGYAGVSARVLARAPRRDRRPEPHPLRPPRHRRASGRAQWSPQYPTRAPSLHRHRNLPHQRCCHDRLRPPNTRASPTARPWPPQRSRRP